MNKQTRWLLQEIDRWNDERVISSEQANQLRRRYADKPGTPWSLIVFATAGAVVFGLGTILLIAYNWDDIPKFGKLGLIFGAVVASHTVALWFWRRGQRILGECIAVLGTMFYGAGIWLVAQVYHIDEHYPTGFLLWALGALAFAWVFQSVQHGLVAVVLLTIWGASEDFAFAAASATAPLLVALGGGVLAWRRRSALLLAVTLAAVEVLLSAATFESGTGALAAGNSLAFGVLLIALARLTATRGPDFAGRSRACAVLGYIIIVGFCYLLSFESLAREMLRWSEIEGPHRFAVLTTHGTLLLFALAAWIALSFAVIRKKLRLHPEEWLLPIAVIYALGIARTPGYDVTWYLSSCFNLILLGIALMRMWRGCREAAIGDTVFGSLLFAALIIARYFDLFHSLASRGSAFLVLGGVLLAEAILFRKSRRGAGPMEAAS
ncbi:MAG TPA: DUF2157 domain-containing protein [Candidatus Didemnitutus sp.]|nr:DUF2157 domain-containing protein [Candidatus Didemnitutus sp.]